MKISLEDKILLGAVGIGLFICSYFVSAGFLFADDAQADSQRRFHSIPSPKLKPQTIPELFRVEQIRYSTDDVLAHVTLLNNGSDVPIYFVDDAEMFCWLSNFDKSWAGSLYGIFNPAWRDGRRRIVVWGKFTRETGVFAHEYTHYLEAEVPFAREEIRKAFQKLFSDHFRIGYTDLIGPAEPDTKKDDTTPQSIKNCILAPE